MSKKSSTTGEFDYVVSFNSQIPTGWRTRNTRWQSLYEGMDELIKEGAGRKQNVRITLKDFHPSNVDSIFASIRGAMYRWGHVANVPSTQRVFTATGYDESNTPYIVGWLANK